MKFFEDALEFVTMSESAATLLFNNLLLIVHFFNYLGNLYLLRSTDLYLEVEE